MSEPASPRCPVCNPPVEMRSIEVSPEVLLFRCGSCAGVWASAEAARSVRDVRDHRTTRRVLSDQQRPATCRRCRKLLRPPRSTCHSCEAPQSLACLVCGGGMARVRVAGVIVDRCRPCQFAWFDAGELAVMMAHARAAKSRRAGRRKGIWDHLDVPDPGVGQVAGALGDAPAMIETAGEAAVQGVSVAGEGAVELVSGAADGLVSVVGDLLLSVFDDL